MNTIPVTQVTKDATFDDLSVNDYHDLFYEVRYDSLTDKLMSFDEFIAHVHSSYSRALWAQFYNKEINPNRGMRNELRAARGLALLPPTVAEATAQSSPDSMVVKIGDEVPDKIVMIGHSKPITISVNESAVEIIESSVSVTRVTRKRKPVIRPVATTEQEERRAKLNMRWGDVIEAGLMFFEGTL